MDFGSKFVYNYPDSEEEVVSEEELEDGMDAWASERGRGLGRPGSRAVCMPRSGPTLEGSASSSSDEEFDYNYPKLVTHLPPRRPFPVPPIPGKSDNIEDTVHAKSEEQPPVQREKETKRKKHKKKSHKKSHHWLEAEKGEQTKKELVVAGKKWRRADTNVLSVKFGHLIASSNMHTGDPVYCNGCGAVLSHISTLRKQGEDQVWTCEYCYEKNIVDQDEEEVPKKGDVTFMLQPAPTTTSGGRSGVDESLIIFCIDTSGSMCVTTQVPGKVKLRGDRLDRLQTLNTEHENQFMPGQQMNVTFVSRLQGVQAAVDFQLGEMAKEHPDRRVALITFNSEVTVVGDGSSEPVHYAGDKLHNRQDLQTAGQSLNLPSAIQTTRNKLGDKIFDLEEGGQTALGPALLLSVAMAAQVKGSKVIMCTDGMANVGLGALDNINNTADFDDASGFFEEISKFATDNGVSVSVTTIKGTDCKLAELGQVAANTGGQVNIVDPMKLTQEFGNILADATIATNVQATLILHKGLYFRDESSSSSKITRQIGNVTKDTEITFEYGIRKRQKPTKDPEAGKTEATKDQTEEPMDVTESPMDAGEIDDDKTITEASTMAQSAAASSMEQEEETVASSSETSQTAAPTINDLKELPFQLHLIYVDLEGVQAMRVITQTKPITTDRKVAEQEMNPVLLGVHSTKQSAQLAIGGQYTKSRLNAFMYHRLMYRNRATENVEDVYDCYLDVAGPIDGHIQSVQRNEMRTRGYTYSDSDNDGEDEEEISPAGYTSQPPTLPSRGLLSKAASFFRPAKTNVKPAKKKVLVSRRMECSDESANLYYSAQKSSSTSDAWNKKK